MICVRTVLGTSLAILLSILTAAAAQSIYRPVPGGLSYDCGSPLTRLLGKTVTIGPQDLCKDFGMGRANALTCTALDIMDDVTKQVTGNCTPHKQAPVASVSATGEPIPRPLRDRRPLPAGSFADEAALLSEEGATHYWYITNVINLFLWAPCSALQNFTAPYLIPDGWSLIHMESTPPQGPYMVPLPMYAVLKSADGRQLAVIIRGTRTAEEWQVDMTYVQKKDAAYPGMLSKGFSFGANLLWPALQAALQKEVVEGGVSEVTVAGHSLGAAMATLLSYRAQVYLDEQLASAGKPAVAVGALLFAPPNVGDDTFVAEFNKKVNARRIAYVYDFVPQVPCAPKMMACQGSIFETALPGVSSWSYAQVGGQIILQPQGMPVQPEVWAKTGELNGCMVLPWALATHICSYTCYYSKAANAEKDARCKLWGQSHEKTSTEFCLGYPHHDPEFPLKGHGAKLVIGSKAVDSTKKVEVIMTANKKQVAIGG